MKIELEGYNLDELIKVLYRKKITLINLQKVKDNHIIFEIEDKDHKKVKKYILENNDFYGCCFFVCRIFKFQKTVDIKFLMTYNSY